MKAVLIITLLIAGTLQAQDAANLHSQYGHMKQKSQTFKDYKVIKETTLDAFWRGVEDSIAAVKSRLTQAEQEITSFNSRFAEAEADIKKREEAVAEIIFDSDHITVLGISFHKVAFISLAGIVVAALVGLLVFSFTRAQFLRQSLKEKSEALLVLTSEHEEYKHRAVEKQMKLSRELQSERNKVQELKLTPR
jgi:hypothetical protein